MDKTDQLSDIPRLVWTYDEAARALGISKCTLERMVARGEMPHVRIPRRGKPFVRFRVEAIAAWLQEKESRHVRR